MATTHQSSVLPAILNVRVEEYPLGPLHLLVRGGEADDEVVKVVASGVVHNVVAEELEEGKHRQAPMLNLSYVHQRSISE